MQDKESIRQASIDKLNTYFVWFILTVFFYGMFRKWFLPSLSSVIYFAPDMLLFYIYYFAAKNKLFVIRSKYIIFYFIISVYFLLAIVQGIYYESILINLYGYRSYCLCLPVVILLAEYLNEKTLIRLSRLTCLIAIPAALLVYYQSISPIDSFINKSVGEEASKAFVVVRDVVRPSSFFSFNTGHGLFTYTAITFYFYQIFLPAEKRSFPLWMILLIGFAIVTNVAVSGSRGNYIMSGIICSSLFFFMLLKSRRKGFAGALAGGVIIGIVVLVLFNTVFSRNIGHIEQRFEMAEHSEGSIFERYFTAFTSLTKPFETELPIIGYGIGLATPGVMLGFGKALSIPIYIESEWVRFIAECGIILGILLILFRITMAFYMAIKAVSMVPVLSNPYPLVLAAAFFIGMFQGQLSFNTLSMYFGWFFFGIAMATHRIFAPGYEDPAVAEEEGADHES